jgi:4-amino-4-deoxy-L-arabinose transferase-like glycosyltransferase
MGQITWLLLTSIISMFLLIYLKEKSPTFIFASAYLLIQIIIFSMVQGMHQFYVATISLPIAIIISMAVREFANKKKPIFIISVMTVSVFSAFFITLKVQHFYFLSPFFQLLLFLTFIALSITPVRRIPKNTASAVFILAIILTPAIWSVDTIRRSDPFNPMAGPTYSELALEKFNKTSNKLGGIVNQREFIKIEPEEYQKVVKYIRSKTNSKFALATFNGAAAPFITSTTDLIYPVGGFNGQDPEPSLSKFVSQVSNGEIRFVLADSDSQGGIKSENQTRIQEWVRDNCINDPYEKSGFRLFDCKQS